MNNNSKIPEWRRNQVKIRARLRCERCQAGLAGEVGQWHHRRSRSVRGDHRHCACNGVWLCPQCHSWAHANPVEARDSGWIVSRYVDEPSLVPIITTRGTRMNDCDGGFAFVEEEQ